MNNSLFCPHNILLTQRCPRCVVERRVSYSNRLQHLIDLTTYENRLLNYENSIVLYRNNLFNHIELQIRDKIISDINYLLSIINNNSYERNIVNIRRFYTNLLRQINLFEPNSYNIQENNLRYAENIIQENRNILRNGENIINFTNNVIRTTLNSRISNMSARRSLVTQRTNNLEINPLVTRHRNIINISHKLSIKDLNHKTTLEIYNPNEDDEEQNCAICLTALENNSIIRKLGCNHKFHHKCVDTWFEEKEKCPICRHNILPNVMV